MRLLLGVEDTRTYGVVEMLELELASPESESVGEVGFVIEGDIVEHQDDELCGVIVPPTRS